MFKKIAFGLIVVGMMVVGYGSFTGMTAQAAAPDCGADSVMLANNPELKVICSTLGTENEIQVQRAIEASAARYTGLAGYYTGNEGTTNSTFLAANPELNVVDRYVTADEVTDSEWQAANPELMTVSRYEAQVEWQRKHFPGR